MSEMYEMLKEGLEGILKHQKGKKRLKIRVIDIPDPAIEYTAKDVKRIRESLNYPQSIFAQFLNVSVRTVESWESGRRSPNHAALRLLEIIDKGYYPPKTQRKSA
ncbi:MAG TPA: helix-turn-helix domain-containing protein [Waddliaceae bacterium]